jgi:ElaB/YqjD/DUF883 family membrane-anchored ribosome-binding protein
MTGISNTQNQPQCQPQHQLHNQPQQAQHQAAQQPKPPSALSQEFHNFLADIETLFKSTTSLTGAELEAAKAKITERIAVAKVKATELSNTITQQARDTIAYTDNYVHEKPWNAVGASAAIGFLLGYILARRS